jgi:hypothetical protein
MLDQMIRRVREEALGLQAGTDQLSSAHHGGRLRQYRDQPVIERPTNFETCNKRTQMIPAHRGTSAEASSYANGVRNTRKIVELQISRQFSRNF